MPTTVIANVLNKKYVKMNSGKYLHTIGPALRGDRPPGRSRQSMYRTSPQEPLHGLFRLFDADAFCLTKEEDRARKRTASKEKLILNIIRSINHGSVMEGAILPTALSSVSPKAPHLCPSQFTLPRGKGQDSPYPIMSPEVEVLLEDLMPSSLHNFPTE